MKIITNKRKNKMNKFLKVIFLSSIVISLSFCADNLVKPIKVSDVKDCAPADYKSGKCLNCQKGTVIAAIVEQGKDIVGCYKCPKDTAFIGVINHNFTCGQCPKGTVLKKATKAPGNFWRGQNQGLEYVCDCANVNSYGVAQPDGSVKCIQSPKGKNVVTNWDMVPQKNGDKLLLPVQQ